MCGALEMYMWTDRQTDICSSQYYAFLLEA